MSVSIKKLIQLYQETNDDKNKEKLFKEILKKNKSRINTISKKYAKYYNEEYDDIYQILLESLLNCVKRYNTDSRNTFITYFTVAYKRNIKTYIKKESRHNSLPQNINKLKIPMEQFILSDHTSFASSEQTLKNMYDYLLQTERKESAHINKDFEIDFYEQYNKILNKDRIILDEIYINGKTKAQLAKELGITRQAIGDRIKNIIKRLKNMEGWKNLL